MSHAPPRCLDRDEERARGACEEKHKARESSLPFLLRLKQGGDIPFDRGKASLHHNMFQISKPSKKKGEIENMYMTTPCIGPTLRLPQLPLHSSI